MADANNSAKLEPMPNVSLHEAIERLKEIVLSTDEINDEDTKELQSLGHAILLALGMPEQYRDITNDLSIHAYQHCKRCMEEMPAGISPQEWAQLEMGWTLIGFQVWCKRHNCNVAHVDFQGMTHPANCSRPLTDDEVGHA